MNYQLLALLITAVPLAAPNAQVKGHKPHPAVQKVISAFYPKGPGKAAEGLMINLNLQDPKEQYDLFLSPKRQLRLQKTNNQGQPGWSLSSGPQAWRCQGGKTTNLTGVEKHRLELLRDGLSLIALWPLLQPVQVLQTKPHLQIALTRDRSLEFQLDKQGLPCRIERRGPGKERLLVTIRAGATRQKMADIPWPGEIQLSSHRAKSELYIKINSVIWFQGAADSGLFRPPTIKKAAPPPTPEPEQPIRLDFQKFPPTKLVIIPDPGENQVRQEVTLKAGQILFRSGFRPAGLPMLAHERDGWKILIPLLGEGKIPKEYTSRQEPGDLQAILTIKGNWNQQVLLTIDRMEREIWRRGFRVRGQPQIIPIRKPGKNPEPPGQRRTEIRIPVVQNK